MNLTGMHRWNYLKRKLGSGKQSARFLRGASHFSSEYSQIGPRNPVLGQALI